MHTFLPSFIKNNIHSHNLYFCVFPLSIHTRPPTSTTYLIIWCTYLNEVVLQEKNMWCGWWWWRCNNWKEKKRKWKIFSLAWFISISLEDTQVGSYPDIAPRKISTPLPRDPVMMREDGLPVDDGGVEYCSMLVHWT